MQYYFNHDIVPENESKRRTSKRIGVASTAAVCVAGVALVVGSPVILAGAAVAGTTAAIVSGFTALVVKKYLYRFHYFTFSWDVPY